MTTCFFPDPKEVPKPTDGLKGRKSLFLDLDETLINLPDDREYVYTRYGLQDIVATIQHLIQTGKINEVIIWTAASFSHMYSIYIMLSTRYRLNIKYCIYRAHDNFVEWNEKNPDITGRALGIILDDNAHIMALKARHLYISPFRYKRHLDDQLTEYVLRIRNGRDSIEGIPSHVMEYVNQIMEGTNTAIATIMRYYTQEPATLIQTHSRMNINDLIMRFEQIKSIPFK